MPTRRTPPEWLQAAIRARKWADDASSDAAAQALRQAAAGYDPPRLRVIHGLTGSLRLFGPERDRLRRRATIARNGIAQILRRRPNTASSAKTG